MVKVNKQDISRIVGDACDLKLTASDISKKYNISRSRVYAILKQHSNTNQEKEDKNSTDNSNGDDGNSNDDESSDMDDTGDVFEAVNLIRPHHRQIKPNAVPSRTGQSTQTGIQTGIQTGQSAQTRNQQQPDFTIDKVARIRKITEYVNTFEPRLQMIIGNSKQEFLNGLRSKNETELNDLLNAIKYSCCSSSMGSGLFQVFNISTNLVENLGCQFGLKLQGYSKAVQENQQIIDTIRELSIENLSSVFIKPEKRLVFLLIFSIVQTHSYNSASIAASDVLNDEIDPSKYTDL